MWLMIVFSGESRSPIGGCAVEGPREAHRAKDAQERHDHHGELERIAFREDHRPLRRLKHRGEEMMEPTVLGSPMRQVQVGVRITF